MPDGIIRIRSSWAKAIAARKILGIIFYENLFDIAPHTRPLFPESLDDQGRKLVLTLSWIVDHLEDEETLTAAARDMAVRHLDYGVTKDHYAAVGEALLMTLRAGLGDEFDDEDEAAWMRVYAQISSTMIAAAYPAAS